MDTPLEQADLAVKRPAWFARLSHSFEACGVVVQNLTAQGICPPRACCWAAALDIEEEDLRSKNDDVALYSSHPLEKKMINV